MLWMVNSMKKIKNKYTQPVQGTKRLTYVRLTIYLFDLFIYASHCLAFYLFIFCFRFFFWAQVFCLFILTVLINKTKK